MRRIEDPDKPDEDGWEPGRWYTVMGENGRIWCQTSIRSEAIERMRPGDTLYRLWTRVENELREVEL